MTLATPIYAALLGLMYVALSARVIRLRRRFRAGLGDGGEPLLIRAIAAHANFSEYVPLTLLLIWMLESVSGSTAVAHLCGAVLLVGRFIHAYSISQASENIRLRVLGMSLTFLSLTLAALGLLLSRAGVPLHAG